MRRTIDQNECSSALRVAVSDLRWERDALIATAPLVGEMTVVTRNASQATGSSHQTRRAQGVIDHLADAGLEGRRAFPTDVEPPRESCRGKPACRSL